MGKALKIILIIMVSLSSAFAGTALVLPKLKIDNSSGSADLVRAAVLLLCDTMPDNYQGTADDWIAYQIQTKGTQVFISNIINQYKAISIDQQIDSAIKFKKNMQQFQIVTSTSN